MSVDAYRIASKRVLVGRLTQARANRHAPIVRPCVISRSSSQGQQYRRAECAPSRDKLGAPYAIAILAENKRDTRGIVDGQLNWMEESPDADDAAEYCTKTKEVDNIVY